MHDQLIALPCDGVDLLCKDSMQNTSQQIVGVAKEEQEDRDHQGRVEDIPLGQETLHQAWTPHQDAG